MTHGVRPVSLHVSDRVGKGFRRSRVPQKYIQSTHAGIIAPTKQAARGDYQCNLPMVVHSRYINKLKQLKSTSGVAAVATEAETSTEDGKKKKREKPKPAVNKVFKIAGKPHEFNPEDQSSLPDTAHDLAYHILSHVVPTNGQDIENPHQHSKNPAQFFLVNDDVVFDSVSVSPQGFLGLKLTNKYISKRLVPFLVQNDAPPLLLFESDMKYVTPQETPETVYDDRVLSLLHSIEAPTAQSTPLPAYPRVVSIDYSSPNIAKEMHIGHIRSTAIGDMLARVLEFSGNTIQRYNHIGDWGTQFGMLLCHYNDLLVKGDLKEDSIKSLTVSDLLHLYQTAKKRFDVEPDFPARAKKYVVELQGGDRDCLATWKDFCKISTKSFKSIMTRLQIDPRLLERGESFYQPFLNDVIDELLTSGVAIERDGAILLPPKSYWDDLKNMQSNPGSNTQSHENGEDDAKTDQEKKKNDGINGDEDDEDAEGTVDNDLIPGAVVLRKTDGGFTYGATDMAAIRLRLLGADCWHNKAANQPDWFHTDLRYQEGCESLPTDWALYVVDSGQSVHFQRIFESAHSVGWIERGKKIAQDRKVQYFNDILSNLSTDEGAVKQNNVTKIAKASLDGDSQSFQQDLVTGNTPITDDTAILDHPDLRIEHCDFGVVCGADGKRLRTRAGAQIKLVDVLDEAVTRSRAIIDGIVEKQNLQAASAIDAGEATSAARQLRHTLLQQEHVQEQLSEAIGYGSMKYHDLSKNRISDYIFNYDTMLDMQGDTAGYLLYAHARLFSMLQRCGGTSRYASTIDAILKADDPLNTHNKLIEHDYQHLEKKSVEAGNAYHSVFDVIVHNPLLLNDSTKNLDARHKSLVSATLAQYNSPYVLNTDSIFYQRRKHNNDAVWNKQQNGLNGDQYYSVSPEYIRDITHNVSTVNPLYGISLSSPKNGQEVYDSIPLISLDHPSERQLALHIAQFHDAMAGTLSSLFPHVMCDYTMQLSTAFSAFYRDCPVMLNDTHTVPRKEGTNEYFNTQDSRVLLTHATTVTLERCLDLIGIQPTKLM